MAGRLAHGRLKTDRLEIGSDMFGCRTALVLVGGISGNRSDPQKREQSNHALINILVDAVEHRLESFHEGTPCERSPRLAMATGAEKEPQCSVGFARTAVLGRPEGGMISVNGRGLAGAARRF